MYCVPSDQPARPSRTPMRQSFNDDSSQESICLDSLQSEEDDTWDVMDPLEPWDGYNHLRRTSQNAHQQRPAPRGMGSAPP